MLRDNLLKIRAWILIALLVLIYPIVIFVALIYQIFKSIYKTRKNIAGEVALVTGGANGLGKEIAIRLAAKGCHIAVVDISEEAARSTERFLIETYKVKAKAFKVDISQYDEVKKLAKAVEEQLGPVTILVNNAGIITFSSSIDPSPSEIQNMINVNIMGHIWTIRIFMDKMRELEKGHIVAISSLAGVFPCHRLWEYTASKFGIRGLMMALRTELYALDCEFIKTTTVFPFILKTNAKVNDIVETAGINTLYPSVSGAEAAEAVVKGIVTNEMDVFIPGFGALAHRLLDFLPKDWQLKIVNDIAGHDIVDKVVY